MAVGSTSTVVASTAPSNSSQFIVNATATGIKSASGGYLACRVLDASSSRGGLFSATPWTYNNTAFTYGTMAVGGELNPTARAGSTIQERCKTNVISGGGTATVLTATLTATSVSHVNGPERANTARRPVQTFTKPTGPPTKGAQDRVGG